MAEKEAITDKVRRQYERICVKCGAAEAFAILKGIIAKSFDEKKSVMDGGSIYLDDEYILAEMKKK